MKYILLLITSLFYFACSDEITINSTVESQLLEKSDGPDAYLCGTKDVTVWSLDHYQAQSGKIVGIWPRNTRMENSTEIGKLKNKYGFNYLLFHDDHDLTKFNLVLSSGYSRNNIMALIKPVNYQERISQFGSIYSYYVDEPCESNFSMAGMRDAINNNAPGSKLIISGYQRTYGLNSYVSSTDGVLFSAYDHWWECLPGIWCDRPINPDQRADWTDMKNRYGSKSFMNWIGAHKDLSDYGLLLGHSANLGLPGVWLYQYQEVDNSEENILNFCYNAWASGYMRRFERKYIYEYRCLYPDPCDCDRSLPDGWYVYKIWPMSDIREVYYQPN